MDIIEGAVTISYEEIGPSPESDFSATGFAERRLLLCDWADRMTLAQQLIGHVTLDGGTFYKPQSHPEFEEARVTHVGIEPWGKTVDSGDPQRLAYAKARLNVDYGIRDDGTGGTGGDDDPAVLVTESLEPAVEFMTVPHEGLYWDAGKTLPLIEAEAPAWQFKTMDWVYTRHQVRTIPSGVFSLVGCCNDAVVYSYSLRHTFPAFTLLYNVPQLSRTLTALGWSVWEISFRFTYRPQGWNKFRKADGAWSFMYDSGGDPFIMYPPSSFTVVL